MLQTNKKVVNCNDNVIFLFEKRIRAVEGDHSLSSVTHGTFISAFCLSLGHPGPWGTSHGRTWSMMMMMNVSIN